jgi:hypothetical protein
MTACKDSVLTVLTAALPAVQEPLDAALSSGQASIDSGRRVMR